MDLFNDDNPFGGAGPAGFLNQIMQNMGHPMGPQMGSRPPQDYSEYMKAYSVAMLPGNQRTNLSYGGKIIMPPSSLARLTSLDLESPWTFQLSNPMNPAASTHAGVLEFIAEEGCVHLPYWMMKTLRLNEGDPVRIVGAELPKGKFVKLQPQSVHFLEISDPKAVLEHALRNFSTLTQGDIIEISYNNIVFDLLIMEAQPGGGGISVLDTDLEVDFAAPVGYKEPERPKAAPPPTMAEKLKIDLNDTTPVGSRPSSSLSGAFAGTSAGETGVSKGGEAWESFKGRGETLSGRKTKGKGISHRGVEQVKDSRVQRTDQRRIVTNETLQTESTAPAPLNLPHGKLFFGFKVAPYEQPEQAAAGSSGASSGGGTGSGPSVPSPAFGGSGNTLSGRANGIADTNGNASTKGKGKGKERESSTSDAGASPGWSSGGQTLSGRAPGQTLGGGGGGRARRLVAEGPIGAGGARIPVPELRSGPPPDADVTIISDSESDAEYDPDVIYVDSD